MTDTPLYAATVRALAGHYAREAVRAGLAWAENPLAAGHHCDVCGTRLDKADRPCPFGPHDEPKARRKPRRTSATRLRILNESVIHYARTANA